ncbi:hypothetical protein [Hydrogenophaga sp. MI9]|uniref:hypothetical protein n=1 Tax=Hydrogenophaga sp. MI9 TaxID=3453719 RepID=UPI003EE9E55C
MEKKEERRLARKIVRAVAKEFQAIGFLHTKPTFIVRPFKGFVQFMHFHNYSFGPDLRVHFGIRVLNDPFIAVALNGPSSDEGGRYWPDEEHTMICTSRLVELVRREGLPWFSVLSSAEMLLTSLETPLRESDRTALLEDMDGRRNEASWQNSMRLLGLPHERSNGALEPTAVSSVGSFEH